MSTPPHAALQECKKQDRRDESRLHALAKTVHEVTGSRVMAMQLYTLTWQAVRPSILATYLLISVATQHRLQHKYMPAAPCHLPASRSFSTCGL
jgi:hypothetical protein